METALDDIASGRKDKLDFLSHFYLGTESKPGLLHRVRGVICWTCALFITLFASATQRMCHSVRVFAAFYLSDLSMGSFKPPSFVARVRLFLFPYI